MYETNVNKCKNNYKMNFNSHLRYNSLKGLNKKVLYFISVLLWFHRILGLTFGGLSIDSNGRIFVNKYYKFYGYFMIALVISITTWTNIYSIVNLKQFLLSVNLVNIPVIAYLMFISKLIQEILAIFIVFHMNIHGFEIIKIFVTQIGHVIHKK